MIVQPMVMTGGGPSMSTYTVVYDIYQTGTVNWEIGMASTMAMVFAAFVMLLTAIQNKLTADKEGAVESKKKRLFRFGKTLEEDEEASYVEQSTEA